MERSLNYWSEAADDPAVASILAETDPEDPDLTSPSEQGDGDESEGDSDSTSLSAHEAAEDQEEF
ncbi:MAG: hypothetical protein ACRDHO_01520 [Actinomycetota bacterium]